MPTIYEGKTRRLQLTKYRATDQGSTIRHLMFDIPHPARDPTS